MLVFRKIWRTFLSCYFRFEFRPFALLLTSCSAYFYFIDFNRYNNYKFFSCLVKDLCLFLSSANVILKSRRTNCNAFSEEDAQSWSPKQAFEKFRKAC